MGLNDIVSESRREALRLPIWLREEFKGAGIQLIRENLRQRFLHRILYKLRMRSCIQAALEVASISVEIRESARWSRP